MRKLIWGIVVILGITSGVIYLLGDKISFFDTTSPSVAFIDSLKGVGADPVAVVIRAEDPENGIDEIIVRVEHHGQRTDLATIKIDRNRKGPIEESVTLDAKQLNARQGELKISAVAFDRSFFSNKKEVSKTLPVDFQKLRIEPITPQHNVNRGGVELVFYRVIGGEPASHGVQIGDKTFYGYSAKSLGGNFQNLSDLYFAFFAIPVSRTNEAPVIFAETKVGNQSKASFPYLVGAKKFPELKLNIDEKFLDKVIPELAPQLTPPETPGSSIQEKLSQFKKINENIRADLQARIQKIMKKSSSTKYWQGPFVRPMAGASKSVFSEFRNYIFDGKQISQSIHDGIDLAGTAMMQVVAAQSGEVVFADNFGIYGDTIIIDHGLGFFTLYGHLSNIAVTVGQKVSISQPIGKSGMSGLAGGDHLHFEIRLFGTPITPIEWWDQTWIKAHINNKLEFVLEQMQAQAALQAAVSG